AVVEEREIDGMGVCGRDDAPRELAGIKQRGIEGDRARHGLGGRKGGDVHRHLARDDAPVERTGRERLADLLLLVLRAAVEDVVPPRRLGSGGAEREGGQGEGRYEAEEAEPVHASLVGCLSRSSVPCLLSFVKN